MVKKEWDPDQKIKSQLNKLEQLSYNFENFLQTRTFLF